MRVKHIIPGLLLAGVLIAPVQSEPLAPPERTDFRSFSPDQLVVLSEQDSRGVIGVIYPEGRYLLSMAASGLVKEVLVREGDWVVAEQPLVELQSDIEKLEIQRLQLLLQDGHAVRAARERLAIFQRQLANAETLYEQSRSISLDELSQLQMQAIQLQAELAQLELDQRRVEQDYQIARKQLEQRSLQAPVEGYITQLKPRAGEWAQAGEPILELVDPSRSYIRFYLSPAQVQQGLVLGKPLRFSVEALEHQGELSYIAPLADSASGLIEIRLAFDNPDGLIKPGLRAVVHL